MNTQWLKLDRYSRRSADIKTTQGVRIELGLSPLDVPEAVRGFRDPTSGEFCIQFRYPDSEELRMQKLSDTLSIQSGKSSGRIEIILLDMKKLEVNEVRLDLKFQAAKEVESGLSRLLDNARTNHSEKMVGLARRIFAENKRDLLQAAEA